MSYVARISFLLAIAVMMMLATLDWRSRRADELIETKIRRTYAALAMFEIRQEIATTMTRPSVPKDAVSVVDIIERIRARNDLVMAVDVFDPFGKIMFSTSPRSVGESVPEAWLVKEPGQDLQEFTHITDPAFVGRIVGGLFEGGGVVVTMRPAEAIFDLTDDLIETLVVGLGAALLAALAGIPIGRRLIAPVSQAARILEGVAVSEPRGRLSVLAASIWTSWGKFEKRTRDQMDRLRALDDVV